MSEFNLKSGNTSPFKMMGSSPAKAGLKHFTRAHVHDKSGGGGAGKTPMKQDYVKDRYHPKFNPTGTKGKVVKKVTTKAAKTAARKSFDKWMLGIIKKGGTRAMSTAAAFFGSMGTAKATQPGTGGHGGKKQTTYNPETGKYE